MDRQASSNGDHRPEVGAAVTIAELTDEHIRPVLARTARREEAAEILGIDVATRYRRRREWQTGAPERRDEA